MTKNFILQPFLSGYDANNLVSGKLKLGKETLATLEGRWDRKITFVDKRTGVSTLLHNYYYGTIYSTVIVIIT